MEVEQVLHMNGGNDDMSYAKNSTIQNVILSMTRSVRQRAVMDAYKSISYPKTISMGDLGCSSGPNTMLVASDAIDAVELLHKELNLQEQLPELHILLNDLPGNDFNGLINSLEDFQKSHHCLISVVPGSFYCRLFPSQSLHFIHSSSSLHWLSQVPLELQHGENVKINKGNIYISETSPPCVLDAYAKQFQRDFSMFLKCRAEEIVKGGCMVLTLMSRSNANSSSMENCHQWELLAQALRDMASKGVVEKEKIDSFNAPYYAPSPEEVKRAIETEGSFSINSLKSFEASWDAVKEHNDMVKENECIAVKIRTTAKLMTKCIRACIESMFVSHFGEEIIDELFVRYNSLLEGYFSKNKVKLTNIVVNMKRMYP
ncbi:Benzoate O-methyltransferase protein [Dioscorea alata]|uniref:Benzoate O-methyltransferase protein n=1 Tax=Dioscorea alata TaxID=55571 RepID=A0ACB7W5S6_DIOAL|nr:Benzoate O-methyltransferase protein [Dioscorea alata]